MPNFAKLSEEIQLVKNGHEAVRDRYLLQLHEHTGRNVIAYYSAWLQRADLIGAGWDGFSLDDSDKNAFMATIHQMDRRKGLDLILHTPGGDVAATESLVDYLRAMFGTNIRVIVPQLAMSAGTMMACASKQIVMGKHSSLGPIDPQFGPYPAHAILEEFQQAKNEVAANPALAYVWQHIVGKYQPTLIVEAQQAIAWSRQMVRDWLITGMFAKSRKREEKADKVVEFLGSHSETGTHSRHISITKAQELGLNVLPLETDQTLQDLVLSIHHAIIFTFGASTTMKLTVNQSGVVLYQNFTI